MDLPTADAPLSDSEIERRFGALLAEGVAAFRADPILLVVMVEQFAATQARRKRTAKPAKPGAVRAGA